MVKIYHTEHSAIDLDRAFGVGAFELGEKLEVDPNFLEDPYHEHDDAVVAFVLREERLIFQSVRNTKLQPKRLQHYEMGDER